MLELCNIHKNYAEGDFAVRALQGVDLQFRKAEFVSILGPSGCGKTTMLNIIGGLDRYSQGDLIIDGVSTKQYGARDWDAYRNHSVGFVFQSYNLIPHQSVLSNVELALSLSGVTRKERRQRAKKALEQVGLGDQLRKKPGQMSGGQMQRVAIARALVNDPDIILADEPTGALDTQTSVQVMEILKEIAKDRLVIMVTHNPDLANAYSTRIIRMLDGKITGDSAPLSPEEKASYTRKAEKPRRKKLPSLSFFTAFSLSLKNLFTKKGRTALTAFAGSIGIIGIALIYAVSQGMTTYIQTVQEDTLSSYPLTIEASTVDLTTVMETFMGQAEEHQNHPLDGVYSQSVMFEMVNALNSMETTENDLTALKNRIEASLSDPEGTLSPSLSGVGYTYDFDLLVYTRAVDGAIIYSDTRQLLLDAMSQNMGADMSAMMSMGSSMGPGSMATMASGLWSQLLPAKDGSPINPLLYEQYELVEGDWPKSYDEIVIVVDKNYEIDDLTLYALGLKTREQIDQLFEAAQKGTQIDITQESWSFREIMDMEFRVVLGSQCYTLDENTGLYTDLRDTDTGLRYLYDSAIPLKVSGIVTPNPDATSAMIGGNVGYTVALTEHIIRENQSAKNIESQLSQPGTDIFTGLPFPDEGRMSETEKESAFRSHLSQLDEKGKAEAYVKIMSIPSQEQINGALEKAKHTTDRKTVEQTLIQASVQQMTVDPGEVERYITGMADEELWELYSQMVVMQVKAQTAAAAQQQLAQVPDAQKAQLLDTQAKNYTAAQCAQYYDEVLEFSQSTYEENLQKLGYVELEKPAAVNFYASSFANKDVVEQFIADYNETVEEVKKITYTDYMGLMMSGITTIIDVITYVLIAFVGISLVVSSIMIGVITLISVQERTKEIGILRALGASKANVSSMFNAETMIIGFVSGLLGVGITYALCIPINMLVQYLTGIGSLKAYLPPQTAVVLVLISVGLTLISGIIPSRSAAKKDPVVALRTE